MNTNPSPIPTRTRHRRRPLLVLLTLALACLAVLGASTSAQANEFVPKPTITYLAQCYNLHQGLHVSFVLANEGLGNAHFDLTETVDGSVVTTDQFDVATTPATPDYFVKQGKTPTFDVVSTDGPGATFHYDFQKVDCEAQPTASIAIQCPADPGGQAQVVYTYANPSAIAADFVFGSPPDGQSAFEFDVSNQPEDETKTYDVDEGEHVNIDVKADNVTIATLDQTVHCAPAPTPRTLTVTNTVVGANPPVFHYEVDCGAFGTYPEVASFDLADGQSKQVDEPQANGEVCYVTETSPGQYWWVTYIQDGAAPQAANGTGSFLTGTDHEVDFTNTIRPQYELDVSKTVVGGTPGETFHFTLTCDLDEGPDSVTQFDLVNGQTTQFPLFDTFGCTVTETDPGADWTTTHALDGGAPVAGRTQSGIANDGDHTVAFVNTLPPDPTTTTTTPPTTVPPSTVPVTTPPTTVPVTTVPATVPVTTVPETTIPATTVPATTAPSTTVPTTDVLAASTAPPTVVTTAGPLARTGSSLVPLALAGTVLVSVGLVLVSLRRRLRRLA